MIFDWIYLKSCCRWVSYLSTIEIQSFQAPNMDSQRWSVRTLTWQLWQLRFPNFGIQRSDFPRWCLCRWGSSQQWHLSSLASLSKSQRPEWHRPNPCTVDLMEALWHGWKQPLRTQRYDQKSTFDSWKGKMEEFTLYTIICNNHACKSIVSVTIWTRTV